MGQLVPVGCVEVLPGDTFQHRTSALIRLSPQLAPVMHPVQARIHHWFVPNRIVWDEWEEFITGGTSFTYPTVNQTSTEGNLLDYLGVPPIDGLEVGAMPLRAYNTIYNENYRDQDLQVEIDPNTSLTVRPVSWEKDYFTTARPWTQKGGEITIPLGQNAPIKGIGKVNQNFDSVAQSVYESDGSNPTYPSSQLIDNAGNAVFHVQEDPLNAGYPGMYADLSVATGTDVRQLRMAFALQRYQEARARYGSRFTEYLRYLGIRSSDARLQRPEYLGGGKATISFSEVLQTAPGTSGVVGDLLGHGIAAIRTRRYRRFFEEHGHVITLLSVRPKAMYMESLHKKYQRRIMEDYYQKELEHVGQEEIRDRELWAQSPVNGIFGYGDRYRNYREEPSTVHAEFRSTLDYWHLARGFQSQPVLNSSFTDCVPSKRIFAEQTQNSLWVMVNHSLVARRLVGRSAYGRVI